MNQLEIIVAFHEAGHTLLAILLGYPVEYVSLNPNCNANGATFHDEIPDPWCRMLSIAAGVAGERFFREGEERVSNTPAPMPVSFMPVSLNEVMCNKLIRDCDVICADEDARALIVDFARKLVEMYPLQVTSSDTEKAWELASEAWGITTVEGFESLWQTAQQSAYNLLAGYHPTLDAIAVELIKRRTLTFEDLQDLISRGA